MARARRASRLPPVSAEASTSSCITYAAVPGSDDSDALLRGLWLGKPGRVVFRKPGAAFLDFVLLNLHSMVASPLVHLHATAACRFWITPVMPSARINVFFEKCAEFPSHGFPGRVFGRARCPDVFCALAASPDVASFIVATASLCLGRTKLALHRRKVDAMAAVERARACTASPPTLALELDPVHAPFAAVDPSRMQSVVLSGSAPGTRALESASFPACVHESSPSTLRAHELLAPRPDPRGAPIPPSHVLSSPTPVLPLPRPILPQLPPLSPAIPSSSPPSTPRFRTLCDAACSAARPSLVSPAATIADGAPTPLQSYKDALLSSAPPHLHRRRLLAFLSSPVKKLCHKCYSAEHLVRDCRDPVRCRDCGRSGHLSSACFPTSFSGLCPAPARPRRPTPPCRVLLRVSTGWTATTGRSRRSAPSPSRCVLPLCSHAGPRPRAALPRPQAPRPRRLQRWRLRPPSCRLRAPPGSAGRSTLRSSCLWWSTWRTPAAFPTPSSTRLPPVRATSSVGPWSSAPATPPSVLLPPTMAP
ncbi:hypothetical protein VPH35_083599 [Triticum aestivum]